METKTIKIPTLPGVFADVRVYLDVHSVEHLERAASDAMKRGLKVEGWTFTPPPNGDERLTPRKYAKWVEFGVTVVVAADVPPISLED